MFYNANHYSQTGASHVRAMKPCQDCSSSVGTYSHAMAIVADGHGGSHFVRSNVGALKAAESLRRTFYKFVMPFGLPFAHDKAEDCLRHMLLADFEQTVLIDMSLSPLGKEELIHADPNKPFRWYGTTLCGVLTHSDPDFTVCVACGDGEIILLKDGKLSHPLPAPETESLSITPGSMCHLEPSEIRVCILPYRVEAALAVTDGVVNSLTHENALDEIAAQLFLEMTKKDPAEVAGELPELLKLITEKGCGDDVSIAVFAQAENDPVVPSAPAHHYGLRTHRKKRLRWFKRRRH